MVTGQIQTSSITSKGHTIPLQLLQASVAMLILASVQVFRDGSATIVAPGVEMGQGLHVKVLQTAAYELAKVSAWTDAVSR